MDGGSEFQGRFQQLYDEHLVEKELTPPNSPQFKVCAERGLVMLGATSRAGGFKAKRIFHNCRLPEKTDHL